MSIDIRLPNINATNEKEQLQQIRSYLYQFAEQMNWAMKSLESGQTGGVAVALQSTGSTSSAPSAEKDAASNFSEIKSLIIKSADIVNAYYEQIENLLSLSGKYVAQADFGEGGVASYIQETNNSISATSSDVTQSYENIQKILDDISERVSDIETNAYIRTGLLGYDGNGVGIYGVEVGQRNLKDGQTVIDKFARFTSDRLSFYDASSVEVAYISDRKLHITEAEVTTLYLGGYKVDTSNGLNFQWVGGDA